MKEVALLAFQLLLAAHVNSWNEGSVLLRDVQVLTLYKGRFTTARRSSPVPQLQCVGGSAGCSAFVPEVVQCQNKGWDGLDVQWECKTDMDNAYRFGKVEVSCEGFSHPDDPYILRGSCGLEYALELTKEGRYGSPGRQKGAWQGWSRGFSDLSGLASSFFSGFSSSHRGNSQHHRRGDGGQSATEEVGGGAGGLLVVALLLLMAYGVYKLFLGGASIPTPQQDGHQGDGYQQPPPPGFRSDFTGSSHGYPGSAGYHSDPGYQGASAGYGFRSDYGGQHYPGGRAAGGGGFWTGMGTGGVLGYLFGSQRRQPYTHFQSWNTSSSQPRAPPPANPTTSTGTRTASGFGGTKRR